MDSVDTPALDTSFDEADAMPSFSLFWVSMLGYYYSDNYGFQLSNLINYGERLGLYFYLYHRLVKCQATLIYYFSSHPVAFRFWASLPPDNITLNPANKRTDWSVCDFQTGISVVAHSILDRKQLISYTRASLVDTIVSIKDSDGGVITASDVHECTRFITLWTMLCPNRLIIWHVF